MLRPRDTPKCHSKSSSCVLSLQKSANSVIKALKSTTSIDVYSDEKPGRGLDELLQRRDIEAVIVLLPILVLPDVIRKCLAAGKHVLAEKPIAKDIATGRALIAEYESTYTPRNLVFSVAEHFRYDTGFVNASEIVASGTIGELQHVVNPALRFSKGAQGRLCAGPDTTVRVEGGDGNAVSEEIFWVDGNVNEIGAFVQAIAAGKGDRAGSPREALADVAVIESVCAGGGLVQSHEILS
ncbi:hypothetical protein ACJ73_02739 [Blastomyces percursus]|uniref:Gfo/Idh/MocA-like oxidoreductase N-terminal domain-containing protein n=1 Tax=Blastomyces percursus TaxID=1658174 RepID=A0A1J9QBQ8_9EURO|nr:hypothetical protein ACJ73_02739 [Blastomyces percursus]